MILLPLDYLASQPCLVEFCTLLRGAVGPNGRLRLIQSSGGLLTLTSSSTRLLPTLTFNNPVIIFLSQAVKSQIERFGNGGLYCGVISSTVLQFLLGGSVPRNVSRSLLPTLLSILQSSLCEISAPLHIKVSLDSVIPLLIIAKSVLSSKPGVLESVNSCPQRRASAVVPLVRAFLDVEGVSTRVLLNVHSSYEVPELSEGVKYYCSDDEHHVLNNHSWENIPLLLVTCMLTDKPDPKEEKATGVEHSFKGGAQLDAAKQLVESAVCCGIRVIACQRVCHPTLLLSLRRRGVLVLHRLGKKVASSVEIISGATPISSLDALSASDINSLQGHLKSVKLSQQAHENYLVLEGTTDCKVKTLSLSSSNPKCAAELELLCNQAVKALVQTVKDGVAVPGGGCCETYLGTVLYKKVQEMHKDLCEKYGCSSSQLDMVVRWLQLSLLHAVGLNTKNGTLAVDSVYCHAWKCVDFTCNISGDEVCYCGLVFGSDVLDSKGQWQIVCDISDEPLLSGKRSPLQPKALNLTQQKSSLIPNIIFDVLSAKSNALSLAVESCMNVLNIGAVLLKPTNLQ